MFKKFFSSGKIDKLDLTSIQKKLIDTKNWSSERAQKASDEYRKFLKLIAKNPDSPIVPWLTIEGDDDLDQVWHLHILDTQRYVKDCEDIFGKFIHHDPHIAQNVSKHNSATKFTKKLYESEFKEAYYGTPVEIDTGSLIASNCSVGNTDTIHHTDITHHSHSDSGSSHHSCSTHSCSSHSCSSHSCGSSCGSSCGGH